MINHRFSQRWVGHDEISHRLESHTPSIPVHSKHKLFAPDQYLHNKHNINTKHGNSLPTPHFQLTIILNSCIDSICAWFDDIGIGIGRGCFTFPSNLLPCIKFGSSWNDLQYPTTLHHIDLQQRRWTSWNANYHNWAPHPAIPYSHPSYTYWWRETTREITEFL